MDVVGVDGCKAGWFYVRLTDTTPSWGVAPTALDLYIEHQSTSAILIDVPLGLRDEGLEERHCDLAARKVLGRRGSSVFPAPSRRALAESSYEGASAVNRRLTGRGLSKQSWAIAPKIRELDDLLRTNGGARSAFREVHPEVCFAALNGGSPMAHNKKTPEGAFERRALLADLYPASSAILAEIGRPPRGVGWDDILDALCAAVVGTLNPWKTLPEKPEKDGFGLPMEMVFASVSRRAGSDYV